MIELALQCRSETEIDLRQIGKILDVRRDQSAPHQAFVENVDENVEDRARQGLRQCMFIGPAIHELGHGVGVVGAANLAVRGAFGKTGNAIGAIEIAMRLIEHLVDDGREVHRRDQRHAIGE